MHIALWSHNDSSSGPDLFAKALIAHRPRGVHISVYRKEAGSVRAYLANRVDILHVMSPAPAAVSAIHAAWHLNIPIVGSFATAVHDGSILGRTYLRLLSHFCDRILTSSEFGARRLISFSLEEKKLVAWRPGVDCDRFSPLRRSQSLRELWRVSDDRPAVVYAGSLDDDGIARRLISLDAALRRSTPMHRLIVAGDGYHRRDIEARCRDAVFTDSLEGSDISEVLASSDVFVWPGEDDSPALQVLEAQASGLPCVVMEHSSAAERATIGSAATCRSVVDLIVATAALARDRNRRTAMGRAARSHALQQDWEIGLAPIYAGYRSVDAESRARRALGPPLVSQSRRL